MNKKVIVKLLITIICSILFFSFIIGKISGFRIYEGNNFDENISLQIEYSDGSIRNCEPGNFPLVSKGDVIHATIDLPKEKYIRNSAICFYVYHSIIHIYDNNNEILYEYGEEQAEKGEFIGKTYIYADLPEESWGKSITIKLEVQEDGCYSKLYDFTIIKSLDAYKFLLANKELELFIFLPIFIGSVLVSFVLIFEGTWNSIKRQGIYLSAFFTLICLWYLEYNGTINIFITNKEFISHSEYIALFAAPIMLALFFAEHSKDRTTSRIQLFFALMFSTFAFIAIILNHFTINYHYCKVLSIFHLLLLIAILVDVILIIKYNITIGLSNEVMRYGAVISLIVMFIELMRFNLYRLFDYKVFILSRSIISLAIITFIITIMLSYVVKSADHYVAKLEKKNLEKLAYYDSLTGISNRAGCYRYLKKLNSYEENAVVFMDVNKLKYANDVFGHEMGDKLIKFVADALKTAFEEDGFCGRFGGDEFIAEVYASKIDECIGEFNEILDNANREEVLPFEISVSYGISANIKNNRKSIEELLREADKKMYKNKSDNQMNRQ